MKNNYPLLSHNTFGIPAHAAHFAEYASVQELSCLLQSYYADVSGASDNSGLSGNSCLSCQSGKLLHIGAGSNLLFLRDFDGLVLHSAIRGIELLSLQPDCVIIRVGAAVVWDDLVDYTLRQGWYGLENLSLIPGEVGAAAVQNIGAYGSEVKDFILRVHLFDLRTLESCCKTVEEMHYAYRYSALKSDELRGRYAVTHVEFRLSTTFTPHIEYGGLQTALQRAGIPLPSTSASAGNPVLTAQQLRQVIIQMRQSKLPDPRVLGNAGSFFMNPVVPRSLFDGLFLKYPQMPHYEVDADHVKIPAGWLIEQAGWKGRSLGPAGVYEKQALVLVNLGGATGQDIQHLCETVRRDVREQFGIDIHPEVNFIE